jgi:hypothetical protein
VARTRWPSDLRTPASCTGQADQTGSAGGYQGLGPADRSISRQPERRRPIRRSGQDPGLRPYARTRPKPRKQGRKHNPHPPCRLCAACQWLVRRSRAAQNAQFWCRCPVLPSPASASRFLRRNRLAGVRARIGRSRTPHGLRQDDERVDLRWHGHQPQRPGECRSGASYGCSSSDVTRRRSSLLAGTSMTMRRPGCSTRRSWKISSAIRPTRG